MSKLESATKTIHLFKIIEFKTKFKRHQHVKFTAKVMLDLILCFNHHLTLYNILGRIQFFEKGGSNFQ